MAQPKQTRNGSWTLLVSYKGLRKRLTLGKIERNQAVLFAASLDSLISQKKHSSNVSPQLQNWLASLSPNHRQQISELGIISEFNPNLTIENLIENFLEDYERRVRMGEIKPSSLTQFRSAMLRFPANFKATKLTDIKPLKHSDLANAKPIFSHEVKQKMTNVNSWQRDHYAVASWSRANGRLREIGVWAVENGFLEHNPFTLLPKPKQIDESRNVDVKREWVLESMEQALHPDTRLLFVLGRFCGFRLMSEARTLRPGNIDYRQKILTVLDSKKQKHRQMPLFRFVAEEFQRHAEVTGLKTTETGWSRRFVLTEQTLAATDTSATQKMKIAVKKAGHPQWERANQNLRSSCENDLLRQGFPERLVTLWMGHTIDVSRRHYQKQFEQDFADAVDRATY
jgi:integrase